MSIIKGTPCPQCGGNIMYNGSYFCLSCSWIMDTDRHPESPENDFIICTYLSEQQEEHDKKGDKRSAQRMSLHLSARKQGES